MTGWITSIRQGQFTPLLGTVILLYLASPLLAKTNAAAVAVQILFTLAAIAAVIAVANRRALANVAIILAGVWVISSWIGVALDLASARIIGKIVLLGIAGLTLYVGTARILLRAAIVDRHVLSVAIATYLWLGVAWAVSYEVIEEICPGSFSGLSAVGGEMLYFSLTTLTTLGYGDINPVSPFARAWATLEAATGTLYIAVMIAALVSRYQRDQS